MLHFLDGAKLVFGQKRFWRYVAGPWALSAALFLIIAIGGLLMVASWWSALVRGAPEPVSALGPLLYILFFVYSAGFVFLAITSFTSSIMWERLSQAVEDSQGGTPRRSGLTRSAAIGDSIARGVLAMTVAVAAFCCGLMIPVVAPLALAGWIGLLDYTSAAYLRRDVTLGKQIGQVLRLPGALGFLAVAGLVSLVPLLNVLLLPALVAGGTLMVMRAEQGTMPLRGQ